MTDKPPADPAVPCAKLAQTWADKIEEHCTIRMQELGIPENMNGQPDYGRDGEVAGRNHYTIRLYDTIAVAAHLPLATYQALSFRASEKFGLPLKALLRDAVNAVLAPSEAVAYDHQAGTCKLFVYGPICFQVDCAAKVDMPLEQGQS